MKDVKRNTPTQTTSVAYVDWKKLNHAFAPHPRQARENLKRTGGFMKGEWAEVAKLAQQERAANLSALRDLGRFLSGMYESVSAPLVVRIANPAAAARAKSLRRHFFTEVLKDAYPGAFFVPADIVITHLRECHARATEKGHDHKAAIYAHISEHTRSIATYNVAGMRTITCVSGEGERRDHQRYQKRDRRDRTVDYAALGL